MRSYLFTVTIRGLGNDSDQAWHDACEQFSLDPGPTPDESEYKIDNEEI